MSPTTILTKELEKTDEKSKHIFAIMAVAYVVIAIASSLQWIVINENILLGLSMSALFLLSVILWRMVKIL